jgi:MFS family permease
MYRRFDLGKIAAADFVVRTGYQMGKTPLLPIFAAGLGAEAAFLGLIVSVSTLTGMLLKPTIGILSDRWGRRGWLLLGILFFAITPFFYRFVDSQEELLLLRLVHGLATAIFGPVSLAFVAEQGPSRRGERLGWFSMARSGGYILGPALGGWLLLTLAPATVFTLIGLLSCVALAPALWLQEPEVRDWTSRASVRQQMAAAIRSGSRTASVWLAGALELCVFVALYAAKAFLPLFALSQGISIALVGLFFSVQEIAHLALKPLGGRLGDRVGHLAGVTVGMVGLGICLPLLGVAGSSPSLLVVAFLVGAAQALIFPNTLALVSEQVDHHHVGAGMGAVGTMRNAGKVAGPILGGGLIGFIDFESMLWAVAAFPLAAAGLLGIYSYRQRGQAHGRSRFQRSAG